MTRPDSISTENGDAIQAGPRPGLLAIVAEFKARDLESGPRLDQGPSIPAPLPSSDPAERKPSGRERGRQPGHGRDDRRCGEILPGCDRVPTVCQVHYIPEIKMNIMGYYLHRSACPRCGESTCGGGQDDAVSGDGPRTQVVAARLAGDGRSNRRRIPRVIGDLCGLPTRLASAFDPTGRTTGGRELAA